MGEKQMHAPHGIGAHQSQPSGDAIWGSQVTGVVSGAQAGAANAQSVPSWKTEADEWMRNSLQKGLDGELERIEHLEARRLRATGAERDAIDQALESHRTYADLLRRQARERGWTLSENSPRRVANKAIKAFLAAFAGAAVVLTGAFFASRGPTSGELVADAAPGVGTADEPAAQYAQESSSVPSAMQGSRATTPGATIVVVEQPRPQGTAKTAPEATVTNEVAHSHPTHSQPTHGDVQATEPASEEHEDPSEDVNEGSYSDESDEIDE